VADAPLTWITNFIWGIANDVLRDIYVRGKYRDVIMAVTVLPRLNAVLERETEGLMAEILGGLG
jgi:type I restriction enzyme M protein